MVPRAVSLSTPALLSAQSATAALTVFGASDEAGVGDRDRPIRVLLQKGLE
jgi:hypothetical protein